MFKKWLKSKTKLKNGFLSFQNLEYFNIKLKRQPTQIPIKSIKIDISNHSSSVLTYKIDPFFYIYTLADEDDDESTEEFCDETDENEQIIVANSLDLPSLHFHQLWESLEFGENIKERLLNFVQTSMIYSDAKVNPLLISWNRIILLYGPPGTGKTSLCKALVQKLSIRLQSRFSSTKLIEINAHSLFSKWYSESGKLVFRLFQHIHEICSMNDNCLVCVLIDEVESLANSRTKSLSSGNEPSDGIRVVNALLTQIDKLKKFRNVLVLTTSNISQAIDGAFVNRADIKQYIGYPCNAARYLIMQSCLIELMRTGIICDVSSDFEFQDFMKMKMNAHSMNSKMLLNSGVFGKSPMNDCIDDDGDEDIDEKPILMNSCEMKVKDDSQSSYSLMNGSFNGFVGSDDGEKLSEKYSEKLFDICRLLDDKEFSGRSLRKLPFLAHSYYIQNRSQCSMEEFLVALKKITEGEIEGKLRMKKIEQSIV